MGTYIDAVEEIQDEQNNTPKDDNYKIATVTSLFEDGCPKITFVGEEQESSKKYPFLYNYIPTIGDIILLVKTNSTYIIQDKITYNTAPKENKTIYDRDEIKGFAEEQINTHKFATLTNRGVLDINSTYYNYLRYLESSKVKAGSFVPSTSYNVTSLSSTAELSTVIDKVNSIISALAGIGLINN